METTYGASLQLARKFMYMDLGQFTANTTVTPSPRFGCVPGVGKIRILGLHICCDVVPVDADGTMLINALVNDISEGADDTLVSSGDLEALVVAANKWYELTLAADSTEKIRTLETGDSLRFTLVNNSAAIGTNPKVQVAIEYILLPRLQSEETEWPKYVGRESQY